MSSTKATNANNAATVSVNERVATIPLPFAPLLEEADSNEAAFLLLPGELLPKGYHQIF